MMISSKSCNPVTTPPLTAAAPRLRQLPVTDGGLGAHPLPTPKSKPCNVGPIFQLVNLEAQRVAL